jgi:hypothetical protein
MTRRILFAATFAAVALSATGCCGVVRNFVYRIRHCNGCYPAFGGYAEPAVVAPSYAGPVMHPGPIGDPGCATCGSSPVVPYQSAGVPIVPPAYAVQPGTTAPFAYSDAGGKVAGAK